MPTERDIDKKNSELKSVRSEKRKTISSNAKKLKEKWITLENNFKCNSEIKWEKKQQQQQTAAK